MSRPALNKQLMLLLIIRTIIFRVLNASHRLLCTNVPYVDTVELLGCGVTTGDMLANTRLRPGLVFWCIQTAVSALWTYSMY